MNRYLLNRLSAIFWLVLIFGLFAKKAAAYEYTADFYHAGGIISSTAVSDGLIEQGFMDRAMNRSIG